MVFLWEIWEGGLTWCGTLCASIGLAARWTYWLATATIILGTLQLTYWSFVWVIRPILVVVYALTRYVLGHGSWEAVLRGSGELPYEVKWVGPRGQQPWAVNYVQDQVRGRGEAELHVGASGVAPQHVDVDLNELAGRGPFCRALFASRFMALRSILSLSSGLRATVRAITSCCCCSRVKHPRRVSRPGREEEQTPRHDLSETESEEDENPCQADAIGWKEGSQIKRLCKERCNDAACGWVRLMGEDAHQSSSNELTWDGLQASCQLCARHKESYELSKARRACSVEGCEKGRSDPERWGKAVQPTAPCNASGPGRPRATGPTESEPKRHSQDATSGATLPLANLRPGAYLPHLD